MGCDGIFDKLSSEETVKCAWNSASLETNLKVHKKCGIVVETILKNALYRKSLDNVTALIIAFPNFNRSLKQNKLEDKENQCINVNTNTINTIEKTDTGSKLRSTSTKMADRRHFDFRRVLGNLGTLNTSYINQ